MTTDTEPATTDEAFDALTRSAARSRRRDLVDRVATAQARYVRPSAVICVVGEFKQGKSSLVNGILGAEVCPVDDDLATSAVTVVRYADTPSTVVHTRVRGEQHATAVPPIELRSYVTEAGNPDNHLGVERVEVGMPSRALSSGLVVVDTPGVGGLGAGHAAATLAFLPFADGLVFVSDVSAELSAPEVSFLREASTLCPSVIVVQPKIDIVPEWRRIVEINRGHLERVGLALAIHPVSTELRIQALDSGDRELNDRSGYPAMLRSLQDTVIGPTKRAATERACSEACSVVEQLRAGPRAELAVIDNPSMREALVERAAEAGRRLEQLRGPGARWGTVLADRIADLSSRTSFDLRVATRDITRTFDERIEALKTAEEWEASARDLQTAAATAVVGLFATIERARDELQAEIAEMLGADEVDVVAGRNAGGSFDVARFWRDRSSDRHSIAGKTASTGLTGLRGAQSGIMLFGTASQFLPVAAATFLVTNPVLLTAGALFGGLQLFEDRKRKLAARRQAARTQLRQFVDDLSFELGNEINGLVRSLHRDLRDGFSTLIGELQQTLTESAKRAADISGVDPREWAQRRARAAGELAELDRIDAVLRARTVPVEAT
jgi:hypothetical protein